SSDLPHGGRTINDILLTIEYGSGGSVATVLFYMWKDVGGGNFDYVLQPTDVNNVFARTNENAVSVPFGSFGTTTYNPLQFVEGTVNITTILESLPNPCLGASFKTLLIKTKNSNSLTAALNDFVEPIQVQFDFGIAEITYEPNTVCSDSPPIMVTQTGLPGGTYSSVPPGLDININTGEINVENSLPGTYVITYTYGNNGCVNQTSTNFTITEIPLAPEVTVTQPTCAEPTGTITITSPLGANLEYSIDGVNYQSGVVFSGLGAGIYQVTVRDINDTTCVSDATKITIKESTHVPKAPAVTVPQPTCEIGRAASRVTAPPGAEQESSQGASNQQT